MARVIDGTSYLTADEAAERLGTTTMRVLMLMREKGVVGVQLEGEWLVTADSVAGCSGKNLQKMKPTGCASHCTPAGDCACKST